MEKQLLGSIFYPRNNTKKLHSQRETLTWLKMNQVEIMPYWCYSNTVGCDQSVNEVKITNEYIELIQIEDKTLNYTRILWNTVKRIEDTGYGSIEIICQEKYEGCNVFIVLKLKNNSKIVEYSKALNYMAILKGAELMNKNLHPLLQAFDITNS
jgi:hypothetical protein